MMDDRGQVETDEEAAESWRFCKIWWTVFIVGMVLSYFFG